jgi:hypothetical protein
MIDLPTNEQLARAVAIKRIKSLALSRRSARHGGSVKCSGKWTPEQVRAVRKAEVADAARIVRERIAKEASHVA